MKKMIFATIVATGLFATTFADAQGTAKQAKKAKTAKTVKAKKPEQKMKKAKTTANTPGVNAAVAAPQTK